MDKMLPIGTYVHVTEKHGERTEQYYAVVVGYDMGKTKYEVGKRYAGWGAWRFTSGGSWVFPREVTEVTETEATAIPSEASQ